MADENLAGKQCEPCRGGIPAMSRAAAERMLEAVPGWLVLDHPMRIQRAFKFKNFAAAQDFAVKVGAVSEAEGHHPDIQYGWGYCTVTYWTHKIDGLHENDFIMAAKVNAIAGEAA